MNQKDKELLEELFWDDKVPGISSVLGNKRFMALSGEECTCIQQQLVYEYLYEREE